MADERPIIIVKKKGGHGHGHHGGAWKVAYADFVTAMMAFFLVMWILGLSQQQRQAIANYFNDPSGFMKKFAGGMKIISPEKNTTPGSKKGVLPSLRVMLSKEEGKEKQKEQFAVAKKNLEKMIGEMPEFKDFKKYIEVSITDQGLRIELLDGQESSFFRTGSSQMMGNTQSIIQLIGRELAKLPNDIVLEGHTDSRPYAGGTRGYSNWELSTERANTARRAMDSVLREKQVTEVRGYADKQLRNIDDPMHFSNRRISILVAYSDKPEIKPVLTYPPDKKGLQVAPAKLDIKSSIQDSINKKMEPDQHGGH